MTKKPLLLVDFVTEGHHCLHVCHLLRFQIEQDRMLGRFLLSRALHDAVSAQLTIKEAACFHSIVRIIEDQVPWRKISRWFGSGKLTRWLYVEYLNMFETRNSRLVYLFLESVIYQLALVPMPRFSTAGVMFRPTFYYRERKLLGPGAANRGMFLLKFIVAYLLAKRPGIANVFLLDPLAEEYAHAHWSSPKFRYVPDPLGPKAGSLRPLGSLAPMTARPIKLIIAGALSARKGIHSTVDGLAKSSASTRQSIRMIIVGKPEIGSERYVAQNLERLKELGVAVDADLRFISDLELDHYLEQSHVILTPYRGFKGSSGILIRAAHFGKPVISTNEGLLGYLVQRHKLGEAIDVGNEQLFSECLNRLSLTGVVAGFDAMTARHFADECDPDEFSRFLLGNTAQ